MNDLVQALIKAGAPLLGTVIGGPVGTIAGAAIGALAEALGTTPTPDAVKTAIETKPNASTIVQKVEADRGLDLKADLDAILRDRQAARDQTMAFVEKGSSLQWGAPLVSVVVILGFVGLSFLAMKPESAGIRADVALYLLGAWQSLATAVVGYWIGSSAGSATKDAALKQIAASK